MKQTLLTILATLLVAFNSYGQEADSAQLNIAEVEKSLTYQTGVIALEAGNAKLTVPQGFRFLDKKQSMFVLTDLWGNPADSSILGMLVPTTKSLLQPDGWAFTISYDEMGYVKDDDAADINYDDLLEEQQKEILEENPERIKQGFQPYELLGWASHPFYDKDKKVLHWAKELQFGQDSLHTLNYNLRVLGRKGIFMLNAIASMREMAEVKANIDPVIGSVAFTEGSTYADFNPEIDEVAAWSIGGLVAGKVLAKVGFFALIIKFWKLIAIGLLAASGSIWRFITGKKKAQEAVAQLED